MVGVFPAARGMGGGLDLGRYRRAVYVLMPSQALLDELGQHAATASRKTVRMTGPVRVSVLSRTRFTDSRSTRRGKSSRAAAPDVDAHARGARAPRARAARARARARAQPSWRRQQQRRRRAAAAAAACWPDLENRQRESRMIAVTRGPSDSDPRPKWRWILCQALRALSLDEEVHELGVGVSTHDGGGGVREIMTEGAECLPWWPLPGRRRR